MRHSHLMKLSILAVLAFLCFDTNAQYQSEYSKELLVEGTDTLPYRLLLPNDFDENKSYPLIIFLHGAGERGNNNENQLIHGHQLFASPEGQDSFPAVVIFPQCPAGQYWANVHVERSSMPLQFEYPYSEPPTTAMNMVISLLEDYLSKPYTDNSQVYLAGLSMGGMGTFELLYRKPDVFAAAIPICGGGNTRRAKEYATKVPLWVFHGSQDQVVPAQLSVNMVSAILDAGGLPKLSLYDNYNHNSWDGAFAEPELLKWLFSHKKE